LLADVAVAALELDVEVDVLLRPVEPPGQLGHRIPGQTAECAPGNDRFAFGVLGRDVDPGLAEGSLRRATRPTGAGSQPGQAGSAGRTTQTQSEQLSTAQ